MNAESELPLHRETEINFARITEGKIEEAERLAGELLAKEPANAVGWYLRGLIYRCQGDTAKSLGAYNKALQLKPDFRKACEDLAGLLMITGQTEFAFQTYMQFIRIRIVEASRTQVSVETTLSPVALKTLTDCV